MEANQKHFKAGIYQLTDGSLRRFVSFYPLEVHDLMVFVVDYNTCETGQTFSSHFRLLTVVELKGKSSRKLLMNFKTLQKQFWGQHFWARGYFACSSGNITDEVIMQYIENQDLNESTEEDFKIG